jgi:hypothetical protein
MGYGRRKHTGNVNTTGLKTLGRLGHDQRIERIDDERMYDDEGGIWAYTVDGFCNGDIGAHIIHENTAREVISAARMIRPCDCADCQRGTLAEGEVR